jgi:hypothetical protein
VFIFFIFFLCLSVFVIHFIFFVPQNGQTAEKEEEDEEEEGEDRECELSSEVLRGLLEVIFLMWMAVSKQLNQPGNADLHQSLMKKLSVMLPEVLKVTDDPKVMAVVLEVAGKLPPKTVPTIRYPALALLLAFSLLGMGMD